MAASSFIGPEFVSLDVLHKKPGGGLARSASCSAPRPVGHDRGPRFFAEINRLGNSLLPDPPLPKAKTAPPENSSKILTLAVGSESGRGGDCSQLWLGKCATLVEKSAKTSHGFPVFAGWTSVQARLAGSTVNADYRVFMAFWRRL